MTESVIVFVLVAATVLVSLVWICVVVEAARNYLEHRRR